MAPLLIINPPSDAAFVSACQAAVAGADSDPAHLQDALRLRYPDVVVRPRELSGETIMVWYVYRDGRWVSPG
jgi:hypothetical protein